MGNGASSSYHQILNAGFQLAPSAGSASGVLNNPVGYNRVYVHLEADWKVSDWWEGLRQGQCFVSNGPLLRCWVEKSLGAMKRANPLILFGQVVDCLQNRNDMILKARLTSQDPVEAFELIHNGEVVRRVAVDPQLDEQDLGPAPMDQPGWFVVRAVAEPGTHVSICVHCPFLRNQQPRRNSNPQGGLSLFSQLVLPTHGTHRSG